MSDLVGNPKNGFSRDAAHITDSSRGCCKWSVDVTSGQAFTDGLNVETNVYEFLMVQYNSAVKHKGGL